MTRCSFCGKEYDIEAKGLTYVYSDGTVKHLCSSKCKKNMMMNKRKVRWISKSEEGKQGLVKIRVKKKVKKKSSKKKVRKTKKK